MTRKIALILALILAASFVLVGCAGKDSGNIVIGVLTPTSGPEAYYGSDMLKSYELAVKEINAAGGLLGRQIELYPADDGCDASMASQAATKIISAEPDFVVGGYCSGATTPALPLFDAENLVTLISAANSTKITELGLKTAFMVNSPGTHACLSLGDLCTSLGVSRMALIHQGDSYTQNLAELVTAAMPNYGVGIVATEVMEKGAADVSAIVTAIRNANADIVYWCGYFADGSNVIKQLRQGGYTGEICVGDGSSSPELITGCGAAGEGVYVTSPPFVEFSAGGADYVKRFNDMHKVDPGTYSTLSYDTMMVLAEAVKRANSLDYEKVIAEIEKSEYLGLSGLIKFAPNHELAVSNFIILQIKDGAFTLVTP